MQKQKIESEARKREQQKKFRNLYETKKRSEKIKEEGLNLIKEGKDLVTKYEFQAAYTKFNIAIAKFNEIGWSDQTKFIKKEIENARKFEQNVIESKRKIGKIHQELEKQKFKEELLMKEETQKIKGTIKEVSVLSGEISNLVKIKKEREKFQSLQRKETVVFKSKEFRKDMKNLLNLKQALTKELSDSEKTRENEIKEVELLKEKAKADEIKKMLKEIAKKK